MVCGCLYFQLGYPTHHLYLRPITLTLTSHLSLSLQGFSYYISDSSETCSYLSFPVGTSMDRFTATRVGEPLPVLGEEVVEDPETMKERKKVRKM